MPANSRVFIWLSLLRGYDRNKWIQEANELQTETLRSANELRFCLPNCNVAAEGTNTLKYQSWFAFLTKTFLLFPHSSSRKYFDSTAPEHFLLLVSLVSTCRFIILKLSLSSARSFDSFLVFVSFFWSPFLSSVNVLLFCFLLLSVLPPSLLLSFSFLNFLSFLFSLHLYSLVQLI